MSAITLSEIPLELRVETTKTNTKQVPTHKQRALPLLAYYCCCIILLFLEYAGHRSVPALAQITTIKSPIIRNEQYTTSSVGLLSSISTGLSTTQSSTTTIATTTFYNNQSVPSQQQPKSLKFTLVAGKFWKFQIKSNTFTSHKEGELRLHKNVSLNNYIIDDEFWFQYNPKQQLLFAWPNLHIKPGVYQFVLLPSGIDVEADSENVVSLDLAANIIVELIRPIYPDYSNDIDQYFDYKFSLDYLHRDSKYPLLLNQVTAVFETLSSSQTSTSTSEQQLNLNLSTTTISPTPIKSTSLLDKLKGLKPTNRLLEYLLINQSYSSDGELFSLTWTTQSSLINNTITQIQDCRLQTIIDIITKLSNTSLGYSIGEDKYTLYYPLNATAALSTQAIVSTERGQHLLKLNLNGPCRRSQILENLGIVSINFNTERSLNSTPIAIITAIDVEDKENSNNNNNSVDPLVGTNKNSSQTTHPGLPEPEAIDSNTASLAQEPVLTTTTITNLNITTTTPLLSSTKAPIIKSTSSVELASTNPDSEDSTVNELIIEKVNKDTLGTEQVVKPLNSNGNSTSTSTSATPVTPSTNNLNEQQTVKNQPQAKSFANFLDAYDSTSTTLSPTPTTIVNLPMTQTVISSIVSTSTIATMQKNSQDSMMQSSNLNNDTSSGSSVAITPKSSESSLNEDFLGILNNVMDYLVSIAVPASIIVGAILIFSIIIALCHLFMKRKKSKQFEVRNRFKFRYGSERRGFLKNSSKPVILDADRKSLSCGGTPMHQQQLKNDPDLNSKGSNNKDPVTYLQMRPMIPGDATGCSTYTSNNFN